MSYPNYDIRDGDDHIGDHDLHIDLGLKKVFSLYTQNCVEQPILENFNGTGYTAFMRWQICPYTLGFFCTMICAI